MFIFLIPIVIWGITAFIFGFNGLYGQDAHEYLRYSKAITNFLLTGVHPGDFFWPLMYPMLSGIAGLVLPAVLATQAISLLAYIATFYYLSKLLSLIYDKNTEVQWIYLCIVYAVSPFILRSALVAMSDMTATLFTVGSTYYFLHFGKHNKGRSLFLALLFLALAVNSRYATGVLVIFPALMALIAFVKKPKWLMLAGGMIAIVLVSLPHLLLRSSTALDFLEHSWLTDWSLLNYFRSSFVTPDGTATYLLPNLLYAFVYYFHAGYFMPLLFLLPFIRKIKFQPVPVRVLLAAVVLYSLFLAGIPFQNKRFLLIAFPFVAILCFPAWNGLYALLTKKGYQKAFTAVIIIAQLLLFIRVMKPIYQLNKEEKQMAVVLEKMPQQRIYAFEMDVALKSYLPDREWKNLWVKEYPNFEKGSLVLFNEKKSKKQWAGMNPMINWTNLKKRHDLKLVRSFDNEWRLYEIQ